MILRSVAKQVGRFTWIIWPLLSVSQTARAEPSPGPRSAENAEWLVLVSPFVWAPSMSGQVALGGVSTAADVTFPEVFDNLSSVFMGNLEVTNRTLGFYLDGVYAKTHQSEKLYGQKIGLDITQTTLAAGVYYRAYEYALGGATLFGEPQTWRVEPTAGVRWTKLSTKLDIGGLGFSTKKKTQWTDPFIGLRVHADLSERWALSAEADTGGLDTASKKTYSAQAYLGYRLYLLEQPAILRAGYRVLAQDYRTNDFTGNKFHYDVTQRGPVLGLSMRF